MEYRIIGKTGLKVSNLSFGASSLGGVFHSFNEKEGIDAVHTALDQGINFIDVSPYYGFNRAEVVLGKALSSIARNRYCISTKVGRYGQNGHKSYDYSAKRAITSVEESLKRLQIDYIDLINVHDIEFASIEQVVEETLPALHSLKAQGKVGFVGITGLPLEKLKKVVEKSDNGMVEVVQSFCHYCLNDDSLIDYLDYFSTRGIGVINAAPLAMGLLSSGSTPDWHPAPEEVKVACNKAMQFCILQGESIEQLALAYAVNHAGIATTLFSTTKRTHVLNNIKWAETPLNENLLIEVKKILNPVHRITWENS